LIKILFKCNKYGLWINIYIIYITIQYFFYFFTRFVVRRFTFPIILREIFYQFFLHIFRQIHILYTPIHTWYHFFEHFIGRRYNMQEVGKSIKWIIFFNVYCIQLLLAIRYSITKFENNIICLTIVIYQYLYVSNTSNAYIV